MSRPRFLACACPDKMYMALRLSYVEPVRWLGFDGNKLSLFNCDNNNSNNNNLCIISLRYSSLFPPLKKRPKKVKLFLLSKKKKNRSKISKCHFF